MFNEMIKNIQRLGVITAKDVERLTATELLLLIIERLNGITEDAQNIHKLVEEFENILNTKTEELIPIEVNKILEAWKADGTLDTIINENILGVLDKTSIKPQIVLNFDDGYEGDATTIQMLDGLELHGTFSLINSQLFSNGRLSINKYHEAVKRGHEVVAHTVNHLDWRNTSSANPNASDVRYEYGQSIQQLRQMKFDVNHLVVPYSSAKTSVYNEAKKLGCYIVVGDEATKANAGLNDKVSIQSQQIKRVSMYQLGVEGTKSKINEAISKGKMLVLYDHEIGAGSSLSPTELQQILNYINDKVNQGLCECNTLSTATTRLGGEIKQHSLGLIAKNHHRSLILTSNNECTLVGNVLTIPASLAKDEYAIIESSMTVPNGLSSVNGAVAVDFITTYDYSDGANYDLEVNVKFEGSNGGELKRVTFDRQILRNEPYRFNETIFAPPGVNLSDVGQITLALRITKRNDTTTRGKVTLSQIGIGLGTDVVVDPKENEVKPLIDIQTTRNRVTTQTTSTIDIDMSDIIVVAPGSPSNLVLPKREQDKGKIRTLVFANTNTTLLASDFSLKGNANYSPAKGDAITLIYTPHLSGNWVEINRFTK